MFTAALFPIAKTWKQPKYPSRNEWIKKMWYIYTVEYYWAIKRNEIGSFLVIWMNLESVIQSEVCQKEKTKYLIASLGAQMVKNLSSMQETWVRLLSWEDSLEEGMESHSSIPAWRIPMDRGAWWATVHGVTKSRTRLSDQADTMNTYGI